MTKKSSPLATPSEWRLFLYDEVLLQFERKTTQIRAETFDAKCVEESIGLVVVRKDNLTELQPLEVDYKDFEKEYLVFYSPDAGYKSLFERLRDATAHGSYVIEGEDSIRFRHRFGKGKQAESTRLFGCLKFDTLVALVGFINRGKLKGRLVK
jgi:hypothetical protein